MSRNGYFSVSGSSDKRIRIYSFKEIVSKLAHNSTIYTVVISDNSKFIVSGS